MEDTEIMQNEKSMRKNSQQKSENDESALQAPVVKKEKGRGKQRLADFIVDHNKVIRNIVLMLVLVSAFCFFFVGVNYDLTSYLPDDVESKTAINKMREIFGYPGTGRLMLKDVTIYEAKQYKSAIEKVDGVDQVVWCDTTTQIYTSSSFIDYQDIDEYYKDGCAVMDVTFLGGDTNKLTHRAIDDIEAIIGDHGYIVGMAPTNKFTEENVKAEMKMIMGVAVLFIFVILLFTTTSWFEPVLFLSVIGCAIAINKGTNIFLGTISYITNNICDVLQLATSMDYSVFLLHSYEREREKGLEKTDALKAGLMNTITTILASSLTTFFGFIVLVFMRFTIGFDMGIVMAKSIVCSLLMVIFLMPSLLLSWSDRIDRMRHRPFLPKFHLFSLAVNRISPFVLAVSFLLAGPIYVAQGMNDFMYGPDATGAGPGTSMYAASREIDEKFGRSNLLVAIFPDSDRQKEKRLVKALEDEDYVKKVMGMSAYLPDGVPESILPQSMTELFHKNGYARLLIYIRTKPESPAAYRYAKEVAALIREYYPEEAYITGNTPTTEDMENILIPDYNLVNTLAMISIFLVVAISFQSPIMPVAAMIPIMMAIYTNMAFPYFKGDTLIFIAYAVVSCIQLGSTIDYAISSTDSYIQARRHEDSKKKAAELMTEQSFPSILTSGVILVVCGYSISRISSVPAISEVGRLVGRGAILSVFFVVTMMPVLLRIVDPFITSTMAEKHARRREKAMRLIARGRARRRRRKKGGCA